MLVTSVLVGYAAVRSCFLLLDTLPLLYKSKPLTFSNQSFLTL